MATHVKISDVGIFGHWHLRPNNKSGFERAWIWYSNCYDFRYAEGWGNGLQKRQSFTPQRFAKSTRACRNNTRSRMLIPSLESRLCIGPTTNKRGEKRALLKLKGNICKYCKRVHSHDYKGLKLHELLELLEDPGEFENFDKKRERYIFLLKQNIGKVEINTGDISESNESETKKRKRKERTDFYIPMFLKALFESADILRNYYAKSICATNIPTCIQNTNIRNYIVTQLSKEYARIILKQYVGFVGIWRKEARLDVALQEDEDEKEKTNSFKRSRRSEWVGGSVLMS